MKAILKEKTIVSERDTLYVFECQDLSEAVRPGQFFEIRIRSELEPFLRRPISIFDVHGKTAFISCQNGGGGTRMMTEWLEGQEADLIGPLGNGFQISDQKKKILLVGGGIGAAPLHLLAKELLHQEQEVIFLFSPKRDRSVLKAFEDVAGEITILYSENRTQLPLIVDEQMKNQDIDLICTCGPMAMMKSVVKQAKKYGIQVQVSLEEKMGCGIGICMGCAVPIRTNGKEFEYRRVCHDGPVFRGEEVIFGE